MFMLATEPSVMRFVSSVIAVANSGTATMAKNKIERKCISARNANTIQSTVCEIR